MANYVRTDRASGKICCQSEIMFFLPITYLDIYQFGTNITHIDMKCNESPIND